MFYVHSEDFCAGLVGPFEFYRDACHHIGIMVMRNEAGPCVHDNARVLTEEEARKTWAWDNNRTTPAQDLMNDFKYEEQSVLAKVEQEIQVSHVVYERHEKFGWIVFARGSVQECLMMTGYVNGYMQSIGDRPGTFKGSPEFHAGLGR